MPVKVAKRGGKYCVVEPNGSVVKCHSSKEDAIAQVQAINLAKRRKEGKSAPPPPAKGEQDMLTQDVVLPKVVIISDGDFLSTKLFVRGKEVSVSDLYLSARKGDPTSDYDYEKKDEFSLTMSTNRQIDGMDQTVTLRMREKASAEIAGAILEQIPRSVHIAIAKLISDKTR